MHVALAPGESLLPGTRDALERLFADPRVEAALVPLVPQGSHALARTARRYLTAWDGRFLHAQNFFAPATRVASRSVMPGWRNADAAPALSGLLAKGGRIEALRAGGGIACAIADDLGAWSAHFRAEGEAWGALAARHPEHRPFLAQKWWQVSHRVGEVLQASRSAAPLVVLLHLARESAFARGAAVGERSSYPSPG